MLPRDDVFDVEGMVRVVSLARPAILSLPEPGSRGRESAQTSTEKDPRLGHGIGAQRHQRPRALRSEATGDRVQQPFETQTSQQGFLLNRCILCTGQ
jgi:hypothetical protein